MSVSFSNSPEGAPHLQTVPTGRNASAGLANQTSAPSDRTLPQDLHVVVRGLNVPASTIAVASGQDVRVEPDGGRQAGGVPDLVLDDGPGPAPVLGNEQTARMVTSIIAECVSRHP